MQRLIVVVTLCLLALAALGQSTSKYQVAMITEVKPRQAPGDGTSDPTSYDVSVKVGDTIYVVLYTNCSCSSERTQLLTTTCWGGRFRCR